MAPMEIYSASVSPLAPIFLTPAAKISSKDTYEALAESYKMKEVQMGLVLSPRTYNPLLGPNAEDGPSEMQEMLISGINPVEGLNVSDFPNLVKDAKFRFVETGLSTGAPLKKQKETANDRALRKHLEKVVDTQERLEYGVEVTSMAWKRKDDEKKAALEEEKARKQAKEDKKKAQKIKQKKEIEVLEGLSHLLHAFRAATDSTETPDESGFVTPEESVVVA